MSEPTPNSVHQDFVARALKLKASENHDAEVNALRLQNEFMRSQIDEADKGESRYLVKASGA